MKKGEELIPSAIEVSNKEQVLEIEWADLGKKVFPLWGLRKNCPCVMCRGGHEHMNEFEPEAFRIKNPPYIEIKNIKTVGNHAIQIDWGDNHNSGMYRWHTLRELSLHL